MNEQVKEEMTMRLCLGKFLKQHGITAYRLTQEVKGKVPASTVYHMARAPRRKIHLGTVDELARALTQIIGSKVDISDLIIRLPVSELAA